MKVPRWWQWLRPAGLFAAKIAVLRVRRTLQEADERTALREAEVQAVERRAIEAAEAVLPRPTIWPIVLALGVMTGLWGIILNTFLFGLGLLMVIVATIGWMNILLHGEQEYIESNPHESWKSR